MLEVTSKVNNLELIDDVIKKIDPFVNKKGNDLMEFLKVKVMNELINVMNERLASATYENIQEVDLYMRSNHIEDLPNGNGFVIYNNASIPADLHNSKYFDTSGYPSGQFSVAMAFEYGTGITGQSSYGVEMGYVYNDLGNTKSKSHSNLQDGWYLPVNVAGRSGVKSTGYKGFEIYRTLKNRVEQNISKWVNEFYSSKKEK